MGMVDAVTGKEQNRSDKRTQHANPVGVNLPSSDENITANQQDRTRRI
jgi:hypothetical protein